MKTGFGIIPLLLISTFTFSQITIDTSIANPMSKKILRFMKSEKMDSAKNLIPAYISIHEKSITRDDSIIWSFALSRTGDRLRRRKFYTDALPFYQKGLALNIQIYGNRHLNVGKVQYNVGICYVQKGYFEKAISAFENASEIFKAELGNNHRFVGITYMALANASSDVHQFEKAQTYYRKALNIYKAQKQPTSSTGRVMNNLGTLHRKFKDYDVAIEFFQEALSIYEAFDDEETLYSVALTHFNMAEVYTDMGKLNLAKDYFKKTLSFLEENYINSADLAETYTAYGDLLLGQSQLDSARQYVYKGLKILHRHYGLKHPHITTGYLILGKCYEVEEKLDTAILYYQHGLASSMSSFSNIKDIYANPSGEKELTTMSFFFALKYKAQAFVKKHGTTKDNIWLIETLKVCNTAIRYQQNMKTILSYQDQIQNSEEMIAFYEMGVDACFKLYQNTKDEQYQEQLLFFAEKKKANTLSSIISSVKAKKISGISEDLLEIEKELALEITYYYTEIEKHRAESVIDSDSLITPYFDSLFKYSLLYENLIHQIEEEHPKYFQLKYSNRIVNSQELQSSLDDSTVIVSYSIDTSQIFIITLSKNSFNVHREPINYDVFNLDKTIYSLQKALQKRSLVQRRYRDRFIYNSNLLYHYLIEPVLGKIQGYKRLIIIPEGKLNYVPFDALLSHTNESNFQKMPYLINDFTVTNHYSMTLFTDFSKQMHYQDGVDLLAVAPVFDEKATKAFVVSRQHGPLLWSEREVNFINEMYQKSNLNAQTLIRGEADEVTFKDLLDNNYYKTIHLSSHGLANSEQPDLSWVAFYESNDNQFSDSYLHAREIYNLELQTNLLVLSSCESGLGQLARGEGMISINRGFLYAGALNVVYSIWKINDRYTYELMKGFYSHIFDDYPYDEALRQSKLNMIKRSKIAAMPSNWAGVLILGQ